MMIIVFLYFVNKDKNVVKDNYLLQFLEPNLTYIFALYLNTNSTGCILKYLP